jgi:hypothetical protein
MGRPFGSAQGRLWGVTYLDLVERGIQFHDLRRLESAAYKAIETAERARRADLEARGVIRRRGRRLKGKVPLPQAEVEEAQAIETFDNWCWLVGEIR